MTKKTIGIVVGSLRKGSYNKAIAKHLASVLKNESNVQFLEIGNLPLYNPDLDEGSNVPKEWVAFRNELKNVDALLFVTPEYNRGLPAAIKNALDVGSRPYGSNQWGGKPGAVISATVGGTGAFGANHQLRQNMVFLDVFMMQQPEAYLIFVGDKINEKDEVTDEKLKQFLAGFADSFQKWIKRF